MIFETIFYNAFMVVFSSPAYTVKHEMKKSGDSERLRGLVHDTKGISSCFSDFRKVSRTIWCSIWESPQKIISFLTVCRWGF